MASQSPPSPCRSWSSLDFGLHAFLVINPLVFGLWIFSLSALVGGNLFLAVVLGGAVMLLGGFVFGSLAGRWPWTGGDFAWQTRLLDRRIGAVLALTSWWLAVAALAPVYGTLLLVQVIDPLLTEAGWEGLAGWFRERSGIFASSLLAIAVATAFVGLGMRRAAIVQHALVVIGSAALVAVLALLFTSGPTEFKREFDEAATELHAANWYAYDFTLYIGTLDASPSEVDPVDTLRLAPLVLLFALWIGWAGPLAGEVRARRRDSTRTALFRAAALSMATSLVLFVAIGKSMTWDFWNEANNLYWGTLYGTTATTHLSTWPNPVLFATWLTDSTFVRIAILAGMAAWVVGFIATLFLAATRVLLAAASDRVLPPSVSRTTGDSVPIVALGLLVVPACALAALDAYWDEFASWTSAAALALSLTTVGSGVTAVYAFRRDDRRLAVASALFVVLVSLVIGAWLADPVYGIRTTGSLVFLAVLYAIAGAVTFVRWRRLGDRIRSEP